MVKKPKLLSSIRAKLFSAVAMLLVAVIMVVSSTYAWFTLSTAPEVTGMTTAIGANGSLEMALLPLDGDISETGLNKMTGFTSTLSTAESNRLWGNLVDVSDNTVYGMDKIVLNPSALNVSGDKIQSTMLNVPVYGADGRVDMLDAKGVAGVFDGENFYPTTSQEPAYGLRAIGVASGLTPRQLAYRNAKSLANTRKTEAANAAAQSLNSNGSALANIAIAYGVNGTNATYTQADIAPLATIITDLNGANGILAKIDQAYMQYMIAYAASAAIDAEGSEAAWSTVEAATKVANATAKSVLEGLPTGVTVPASISDAIAKLEATKANVNDASEKLAALTGDTITWEQLSPIMNKLADPTKMTVNDFSTNGLKEQLGGLVSSVTAKGGLTVEMASGAGVYADIAEHCGNYTASVTIEEVKYNEIVLNNMNAKMATKVEPPFMLTALGTVVDGAGEPEDNGADAMPMTEFYGYVLDLAFRTNAAESNLLLQTNAIDRIYENNANTDTMGHGSSMTFASTDTNFSNDQVKNLMRNIRIVFFNPMDGTIIAEARLDTTAATVGTEGVTANMYLYDTEAATTAGNYDAGFKKEKADSAIQALNQNQATAISVLVYLDGENVTNGDVGFSNAQSVTGSMNLQFSSSANLVPMENGTLHQTNTPAGQ